MNALTVQAAALIWAACLTGWWFGRTRRYRLTAASLAVYALTLAVLAVTS